MTDAEAATRKVARQLYWVLHNCPPLQTHLRGVFNDLDPATQRHIQAEATVADNAELNDLFRIQRSPGLVQLERRRAVAEGAAAAVAATASAVSGLPAAQTSKTSAPMPEKSLARKAETFLISQATIAPISADSISEFDSMLGEEDFQGFTIGRRASTAAAIGGVVSSTASKPSRRLSLSAGPVRVAQHSASHKAMPTEESATRTEMQGADSLYVSALFVVLFN